MTPRRRRTTDDAPGLPGTSTGQRVPLTRERILTAALALIDTDGVEGFTMRKLGAALGVDPMAVYYHVPHKTALFDGVCELVWARIDVPSLDAAGDWRARTAQAMRSLRTELRAHPNLVPVVGTRPVTTPAQLAMLDAALGMLHDAGHTYADAIALMNAAAAYTIGTVLAEVTDPVGAPGVDAAEVYANLPADRLPHLATALRSGASFDHDRQFEAGLQALLRGWTPDPAGTPKGRAGRRAPRV